ncbi:MAG: SDR family oxidoreductase [Rhodospirillales bacterium]|nr:SDR family oxidoreductase [Rhodospirillales bacterium]
MDLKLTGKTALVTGSTAGIGLAIARRLAAEGASVIVTGRDQAKLDEAVAAVRAAASGQPGGPTQGAGPVRGVLADAGTADGAAALAAAAPSVDILVNNLGIYGAAEFTDITDAEWFRFFEVNVMSGVRLSRHYFPGMLARDWGRIIFIASDSAVVIPGEMIHYGMTKTAQLAVARGLANLTKGTRVTVNTVMPGTTRSAGIETFMRSVAPDPAASADELEATFFRTMRPTSLIQRLIEPEEIASLVAYVASPLAAATNGAALRAEGGIVPTI